jgi:hypothetical protein
MKTLPLVLSVMILFTSCEKADYINYAPIPPLDTQTLPPYDGPSSIFLCSNTGLPLAGVIVNGYKCDGHLDCHAYNEIHYCSCVSTESIYSSDTTDKSGHFDLGDYAAPYENSYEKDGYWYKGYSSGYFYMAPTAHVLLNIVDTNSVPFPNRKISIQVSDPSVNKTFFKANVGPSGLKNLQIKCNGNSVNLFRFQYLTLDTVRVDTTITVYCDAKKMTEVNFTSRR